jgi:diaminopimelate decarboxylase
VAGAKAEKIVFSGVAKTVFELEQSLQVGIGCINVESQAELERLLIVSQNLNKIAPISIRVNPDVDPKTHPYISTGLKENKFGVSMNVAQDLYLWAKQFPQNFNIVGLDCHIGSQITEISPFQETIERLLSFMTVLLENSIHLKHLDIGGGLGICYKEEKPQSPEKLLTYCQQKLNEWAVQHQLSAEQIPHLICEPGRSLVGNSGVLLTTVQYLKENEGFHFALVDAAMNDLMRPSLYGAFHEIVNVENENYQQHQNNQNNEQTKQKTKNFNIVGPICETGDFLGKNRLLNVKNDDVLAILSAGAYGFTMSSQYNTRPRVAEILVDGNHHRLIRHREKLEDLYALELDLLS